MGFNELNLERNPNKIMIGKKKGFDFSGFHFKHHLITVSKKSLSIFNERLDLLYEQGANHLRIDQYIKKLKKWVEIAGYGLSFSFNGHKICILL